VFLVFRVFTPDLREVVFTGAIDPHTPVAQGWLRASHRKLDARPFHRIRPYHTHRSGCSRSVPGEAVQLDVEIWPTSIVVPAGHRIALSVLGKRDYEWQRSTGARPSQISRDELRGCGPSCMMTRPHRPPEVFGGDNTLHAGPERESYVLLPVVPAKRREA